MQTNDLTSIARLESDEGVNAMNRLTNSLSRRQIADQCRTIRKRWSEIEHRQRRVVAEEQQRRLAQLLFGKHEECLATAKQ